MLSILVHILVIVLVPPLLLGIINRIKSWSGGRKGPPLLQLYFDLAKLFRKGMVISQTTTWVFIAGPIIGLIVALLASAVVPLGSKVAPLHFAGDFILFAYLFSLGRFFTASAALDTGSAFEGMGAAREVTFSTLAEPVLFCGFIALAKLSSSLSMSDMFGGGAYGPGAAAVLLLIAVTLFVVLLVENSRIPFDDPNTHLELTMIHEVMVLDHSGPLFGLILYGAAIKLFVLSALVVGVLTPPAMRGGALGWTWMIGGVFAVSIAVGLIESGMARLRLTNIPRLLVGAFIVSLFAVVLVIR
jgi:formate hydrogenlyase subunit 4